VINANGTNALVIDTGANVVANSGVLEATGAGGLTVDSAVANSGTLWADGGNLTFKGDVSGAGSATISGSATLEYGAASSEATSFAAGATGDLKLDQSMNFTGAISGFGAGDTIDLADIGFGANTTLAFAENNAGTGGVLTVSDGTHVANLDLLGQFAVAGFQGAGDQAGGAIVSYIEPTSGAAEPSPLTKPVA
jgi:large repetitive protein